MCALFLLYDLCRFPLRLNTSFSLAKYAIPSGKWMLHYHIPKRFFIAGKCQLQRIDVNASNSGLFSHPAIFPPSVMAEMKSALPLWYFFPQIVSSLVNLDIAD